MTDAEKMAQALRYIQQGIERAIQVLDPQPERADALAVLLRENIQEPAGITTRALAKVMHANGFDPRSMGALVRFGKIVADPGNIDRPSAERIYYLGKDLLP